MDDGRAGRDPLRDAVAHDERVRHAPLDHAQNVKSVGTAHYFTEAAGGDLRDRIDKQLRQAIALGMARSALVKAVGD